MEAPNVERSYIVNETDYDNWEICATVEVASAQ